MTSNDRAAVIETHVSTVFFAGDRAYKLLKPIATAFLDHSDPSVRVGAARTEIELNRRMAPDTYLGEADIVEDGELVDRMIVMRRLPESRRLSALVDAPDFDDHVRAVVKAIATFHEGLVPIDDPRGPASWDVVSHLWDASISEMAVDAEHLGRTQEHSEIHRLATGYLGGRRALFEERIQQGCQRDGHGDLLAQDIFCVEGGPQILDCLAFRDDLRICDVLNDIAFLAMDLERLAGVEVGRRVMDLYREFTNEHHPTSLAHHFIAYRALVRSKVAALRAGQGDTDSWRLSEELHAMALENLRLAEVRTVMVGGAPGTGKTTVAAAIADHFGWTMLSTDDVRKDLAGMSHQQRAVERADTGLYGADNVDATYRALIERARYLLGHGESVVLDASWTTERQRDWCRELASASGTRLSAIECVLDPAVTAERVTLRGVDTEEASDATPEIALLLASRREPWPDAIQVDTEGDRDAVARAALDALTPVPARGDGWPSGSGASHHREGLMTR